MLRVPVFVLHAWVDAGMLFQFRLIGRCQRRDFAGAVEILKKIYPEFPSGAPSRKISILSNTYGAVALLETGDNASAADFCRFVLERMINNKRVGKDDARYMCLYFMKFQKMRPTVEDVVARNGAYLEGNLDFGKVRREWRRFPVARR